MQELLAPQPRGAYAEMAAYVKSIGGKWSNLPSIDNNHAPTKGPSRRAPRSRRRPAPLS